MLSPVPGTPLREPVRLNTPTPRGPRMSLSRLGRRLRLLPKTLSTREKAIVLLAIVGFLGGAIWWGTRNYLDSTTPVADFGGTLKVGLVGQPRYINPLLSPTSDVDQDLTTIVFGSLFKFDKNLQLQPDLAASMSVSEDKKTYTVALKPDLTWHDGQPLNAADVVFTVKAIQDPNWNSPLSLGFKGVGVTQVDAHTVTFTLQEPYAPFASTLTFGILPQHLWSGIPGANATLAELNTKPVGSGSFKFDELTKDKQGVIKRYHLLANDHYYAGKPFVSDILVTFYDTPEDLVQAYRDGDVDVVGGVPYADRASIQHAGTDIVALNLPRYDALFINANSNGYLQPAKVREALSRLIKKSDLVDQVLKGNGSVLNSPLPPGSPGYTADVTVYGYDPEAAKKLLTDDGWTFKEGGWFKKTDKLIVQVVTADTPENKQLADLIKADWEAIGIQVEVIAAPVAELQQSYIRERKYQTLLFGEVIGADPDLYPFWHSTQIADPGLNLTSFSNDDLDKLLEDARKTADPAARAAKQTAISKILADKLFAIYLYSPQYLLAHRSSLHGVDVASLNLPSDRFNSINSWYFNTKRVPKEKK